MVGIEKVHHGVLGTTGDALYIDTTIEMRLPHVVGDITWPKVEDTHKVLEINVLLERAEEYGALVLWSGVQSDQVGDEVLGEKAGRMHPRESRGLVSCAPTCAANTKGMPYRGGIGP